MNQELQNYVNGEFAKGAGRDAVRASLLTAGWPAGDAEEALASVFKPPMPMVPAPARIQPGFSVSAGSLISEKQYPITTLWIFKAPLIIIFVSVVALFFKIWFPYLIIALPILLIANPLIRARFHYSLEENFFMVKQGVISKKQFNLPYGVIQNVFVKQDLFDRLFGLATLRVENAAGAGQSKPSSFRLSGSWNKSADNEVGSSGNKVNIPGLKKASAEALKGLILQKMKEHPLEDSQSGL